VNSNFDRDEPSTRIEDKSFRLYKVWWGFSDLVTNLRKMNTRHQENDRTRFPAETTGYLGEIELIRPPGTFAATHASSIAMQAIGTNQQPRRNRHGLGVRGRLPDDRGRENTCRPSCRRARHCRGERRDDAPVIGALAWVATNEAEQTPND
jgi:hypothetical protein